MNTNTEHRNELTKLTAYQASIFLALTEQLTSTYTDDHALALIAKHEVLIAQRERRRFQPMATALSIVGIEAEGAVQR
jgi:hypothetical protein